MVEAVLKFVRFLQFLKKFSWLKIRRWKEKCITRKMAEVRLMPRLGRFGRRSLLTMTHISRIYLPALSTLHNII